MWNFKQFLQWRRRRRRRRRWQSKHSRVTDTVHTNECRWPGRIARKVADISSQLCVIIADNSIFSSSHTNLKLIDAHKSYFCLGYKADNKNSVDFANESGRCDFICTSAAHSSPIISNAFVALGERQAICFCAAWHLVWHTGVIMTWTRVLNKIGSCWQFLAIDETFCSRIHSQQIFFTVKKNIFHSQKSFLVVG